MNKIHLILPLIGVLIFGGFYWNFSQKYEERQRIQKENAEKVLQAKRDQEAADKAKALLLANQAVAEHAREREIKKQQEEARKKARQDAEDLRVKAFDDRKLQREKADSLKKDLEVVKADIAKIEEDKKHRTDELNFLKDFTKKAEANQKYYYDLLDKIAAAEKAKAEAEAAAAAAARARS